MKPQIQKVALIATLAFIGIGFAGTQQSRASNCPERVCSDEVSPNCVNNTGKPIIGYIAEEPSTTYEGCQPGCSYTGFANCDLNKLQTFKTVRKITYYAGTTPITAIDCTTTKITQGAICPATV